MENDLVIAGLKRKRAELDGELRLAERRIAQLAADLGALDTALRLFDPSIVPASIKPRLRRGRPQATASGSFTRAVLDTLRTAEAPMCARDIAIKIAAAQGIDVSTSTAMQGLTGRVRSALDRVRDGLVSEMRGVTIFWRVT